MCHQHQASLSHFLLSTASFFPLSPLMHTLMLRFISKTNMKGENPEPGKNSTSPQTTKCHMGLEYSRASPGIWAPETPGLSVALKKGYCSMATTPNRHVSQWNTIDNSKGNSHGCRHFFDKDAKSSHGRKVGLLTKCWETWTPTHRMKLDLSVSHHTKSTSRESKTLLSLIWSKNWNWNY